MSRLVIFSGATDFYGSEKIVGTILSTARTYKEFQEVILVTGCFEKYVKGLELFFYKSNTDQFYSHVQINFNSLTVINKNTIPKKYWIFFFVKLLFYKYLFILKNIIKFFKELRFLNKQDTIFINNGGYPGSIVTYSFLIYLKCRGIKTVFYMVNNQAESYKNPLRWLDIFLDRILSKNIFFITGSNSSKNKLCRILSKIDVQSINTGSVDCLLNKKFYNRLNLSSNNYYFFCGAIFEKRKGHIFLLDAFDLLLSDSDIDPSGLFLILSGDGPEFENVLSYISVKKLSHKVICTGFCENIEEYLNTVNCSILTSIENEDFPNIIIESMSCGLPIIATDVAGVSEQIHSNCGILCNPGSSLELYQAMKKIYLSPTKAKQMGTNSRYRFLNYFTKEIAAENYLNYLLSKSNRK